jgi:hypothetical protein
MICGLMSDNSSVINREPPVLTAWPRDAGVIWNLELSEKVLGTRVRVICETILKFVLLPSESILERLGAVFSYPKVVLVI